VVAEMLLSRVSGAYYNTGRGFCIDIAGKSIESIHFRKLTPEQKIDCWNELTAWVHEHTSVAQNWALQEARAKAVKQERASRAEQALRQQILASAETQSTLEDVQKYYALCQEWKDDPNWQTEEAKALVKSSKALWEDMRAKFPEFS